VLSIATSSAAARSAASVSVGSSNFAITDAYRNGNSGLSRWPPSRAGWSNLSHDCQLVSAKKGDKNGVRQLTYESLWPLNPPESWLQIWTEAAIVLGGFDEGFDVWINWYNRRIEGHAASFDIPGDTNREEDKALLARLAAATDEDFWGKGAVYVNTTLQGWIDEAGARVASNLEVAELEPHPQNTDVTQFRRNVEGAFEPDFDAGSNELLADQAACDRHHSFLTTARETEALCAGHNQIAHIAAHLKVIAEAAGDHPRLMRVDLLIARGEWMIADVADAISEIQPDPTIAPTTLREKRIVNSLHALLRDYTALRTLDPALDRRHRLADNDIETTGLVSPQQAITFVNNGVINGAITVASRDVIAEGAARLPENADVYDRKVRRFSEMVRNLPRAMISFLWQHRRAMGGTAIAGVSSVSLTLITNEIAVRAFFANNPGMLSIIDQLIAIIRNVGM
jgi:hypothetical protein